MNNFPGQHLDEAQIEELADMLEGGAPVRPDDPIRLHADGCKECAQRASMHKETRRILAELRMRPDDRPRPDCPRDADWISVAARLLPTEKALPLIQHAAECAYCGPRLREATEDLWPEPTADEEALLAELETGRSVRQSAIAESLADCSTAAQPPQPIELAKRRVVSTRVLLATAAALLVAVGLVAALYHPRETSPVDLVATAYHEHRTLEFRIPRAAYAPVHLERGTNRSALDRPVSLLRAESMISEGLKRDPSEVSMLDAKARIDLLDGNFDPAIETLQRALEIQPASAALLLDIGTAYSLRAEAKGNDEHDYSLAIESQSKALIESPNDSVVIFNRAIVEEKAYLYDRALEDWTTYLKTERDPAWRAEGDRRRAALLQLMQKQRSSGAGPFEDTDRASRQLHARAAGTGGEAWPETLDEQYMNIALSSWLPMIVSSDADHQREAPAAWDALRALAKNLKGAHHDRLLSDLLAGPYTRSWREGIRALAASAHANAVGNPGEGAASARRSLDQFSRAGNRAGRAISYLELTFGLTNSQRGADCLRPALQGVEAIGRSAYPWAEARISYLLATCSFIRLNPGEALRFAERGETVSRRAGYPVLALKGQYYLDGVSTRDVGESDAWNRIRAGLEECWRAPYPPESLGDFYIDLGLVAEMDHEWQFAKDVDQEAVLMRSRGANRFWLARSHQMLAEVALTANDLTLAAAEFDRAEEVRSSWAIESPSARATFEIQRAALELQQGRLPLAAAHLESASNGLPELGDQTIATLYHQTLGELYLRSGKPEAAEAELVEAIRLIEKNKNSLSSERNFLTWQLRTAHTYRLLLELYSSRSDADARSLAFLEWHQAEPLRVDAGNVKKLREHPLGWPAFPVGTEEYYSRALALPAAHAPVLIYASLPSELAIWEVDSGGVHRWRVKVEEKVLSDTATRFSRLCADPNSDLKLLQRDARQLYAWLIGPAEKRLPLSGELILETDPSFHSVPLQILQSANGRYLGERFSIVESAGMLYSRILRSEKPLSNHSVALAVGDPLAGSRTRGVFLRRLPDADREAVLVARRFEKPVLLSGKDATLGGVIRFLPQAEVFHFAGHGLATGRDPGLLMAPDESRPGSLVLLGARDLRRQDLHRLQLAVLSGCDTAVADTGLIDPGSLVRVFLRAGVPKVVASKWSVDSHAGAEMMEHLYDGLLRGDSAATALAKAEGLIRSNPETAHPYYWASFSVFGG